MFKKYRLTVFVVIMMVVILGFASSAFAGQTLTGSFEHGPYTRTYYYYVPDSYDGSEPVPLLMAFHGMGGSGSIPTGNFNSIADEEGFIVVYPSSTTLTDVGPYGPMLPQIPVFISGVQWDPGIGIALQYYPEYEVDDVGFVSRLIDVLSEELNIDQTRVYATGFSSGSMFSWNLAMNLSDKIAAVAPVSSPMTLLFLEQEPVRPITVIAAGGDSDNVVPFHGGPCYFNALQGEPVFASFYDSGAYWVEKNGIDTEPVVDRIASNILRTI
ncbi:MAG: hypothetical protein GX244_09310 [Firmicutes bacterium]|nr:hypothetical protein [Bacillota bacterium]